MRGRDAQPLPGHATSLWRAAFAVAPLADVALDDADQRIKALVRLARTLVGSTLARVNGPNRLAQVFNLVGLNHSGCEQIGDTASGAVNLLSHPADRRGKLRLLLDDEVELLLPLSLTGAELLCQPLHHFIHVT